MKTKPTGLAKTWREFKRPFKRLYQRFVEKRLCNESKKHGMPLERYRRQKQFLSELYVHQDGRVNFPCLEINIVQGCNLNCSRCGHLSPHRKGFVPTEKIVHWFETWSKKIRPNKIRLLGGEPFLHPDLSKVLLETRRIWGDSVIHIVTNGLLIPQASQNVVDALKEAKIIVDISAPSDTDLSSEKVTAGCTRLKENGITHHMIPSNRVRAVRHRWGENMNAPAPFQSSPKGAFACGTACTCPSLMDNQLYKCAILQSVISGVSEGSLLPSLWKDALTYRPLPPDVDANAILEHFRTFAVQGCSICPDKVYVVAPRQLLKPLLQINKKIA